MVIYDKFFTWDDVKNRQNAIKHGVNFKEAASVFKDENAVVLDDINHSQEEDRFIIIGESERERILMVCHCYRGNDDLIRIISAREAEDIEHNIYESGGAY